MKSSEPDGKRGGRQIVKPAAVFMGRIDPVEYVGVSQQRNEDVRNRCGCATFVCDEIYTRSGKADIMHDKLSVKEL